MSTDTIARLMTLLISTPIEPQNPNTNSRDCPQKSGADHRSLQYFSSYRVNSESVTHTLTYIRNCRPSPRPRGSARRKTASSLILRGHF